jgi:hypothetical protein
MQRIPISIAAIGTILGILAFVSGCLFVFSKRTSPARKLLNPLQGKQNNKFGNRLEMG